MFSDFKRGKRCLQCKNKKISEKNKLSYEYIYNYFKDQGCELLETEYINSNTKMKYKCKCDNISYIRWNSFQQGRRCTECGNKKCSKSQIYSHKYVLNYYDSKNYTIKSIYKGHKHKDQLTCPNGHDIQMRFNNFKNMKQRCNVCYRENNFGENHPSFNPNRDEISLNQRLRKKRTSSWIINNMKDDPNNNNFLLNPDNYVVDHIIPVSLFCKLFIVYNLDETQVRNIINQRDNLQLLTCKENSRKRDKGSLFEAAQFLINNGIDVLKFKIIKETVCVD